MASNYNRRSGSSGSRNRNSRTQGNSSSQRRTQPRSSSNRSASTRAPRGASSRPPQRKSSNQQGLTSVRVGDINQGGRAHRVQKSYRRYVIRIGIALTAIIALLIGGLVLYNSSVFTIEKVEVKGVEYLTATEMTELASVPAGTTLLRVDEAGIKSRLYQEAWVQDVGVNRVFPDTLELNITERKIAAVVEVPADDAQKNKNWAIAADGTWLMYIPPENSEEASKISMKVYEDAASVLRITGVPYGIKPEVGQNCSDENVNNALTIVQGMTTSLSDQVKIVSATGTETTTLILENGVEIAFGSAEDIREKERVCLQLMQEHPDQIAYINVRIVDKPTWRATG
ncbi:MAG: cell division protein FtsQ/DivIB [Raoultibacter sp.]|jgi:cell division protein FtsQ